MVKTSLSNAGGTDPIPGQRPEIPHASWPKKPNIMEAIMKQIQ